MLLTKDSFFVASCLTFLFFTNSYGSQSEFFPEKKESPSYKIFLNLEQEIRKELREELKEEQLKKKAFREQHGDTKIQILQRFNDFLKKSEDLYHSNPSSQILLSLISEQQKYLSPLLQKHNLLKMNSSEISVEKEIKENEPSFLLSYSPDVQEWLELSFEENDLDWRIHFFRQAYERAKNNSDQNNIEELSKFFLDALIESSQFQEAVKLAEENKWDTLKKSLIPLLLNHLLDEKHLADVDKCERNVKESKIYIKMLPNDEEREKYYLKLFNLLNTMSEFTASSANRKHYLWKAFNLKNLWDLLKGLYHKLQK